MPEQTNLSRILENILGGLIGATGSLIPKVMRSVAPALMGRVLQIANIVVRPLINLLAPFIEKVLNLLDPLFSTLNTIAEFAGFLLEPLIAHVVSPILRILVDTFIYWIGAGWAVERM